MLLHALNRGVEKRKIFLDDNDHLRFVHNLDEFNNEENTENNIFKLKRKDTNVLYAEMAIPKKRLVEIHAFCLMPNHYHLLLTPNIEGGVPLFMKKVNGGYSKYFNLKYERKGTLFEGRYKSITIEEESHGIHLPYYIHANPLDLSQPQWRKKKIEDPEAAMRFLESYRWSSHNDYLGKETFPRVLHKDLIEEILGQPKEYQRSIKNWLSQMSSDSRDNLEKFLME